MNAESIAFVLDEIHQFNAELGRLSGKPPLGVPAGGATDAAVAAFASAQGLVFPPSYAEFLRSHAGWDKFFNGVAAAYSAECPSRRDGRAGNGWDRLLSPL